jgi:anaerobic ribonucleoside-triphosphate reductase activating protein
MSVFELKLNAVVPRSRANGPGVRTVVWFQGCVRRCRGCFNPETHALSEPRLVMTISGLLDRIILTQDKIDGITISGGEPFLQPEGLWALVSGLRRETGLSIILYSGYLYDEIKTLLFGPDVLKTVDVLIDGPYDQNLRLSKGLKGSSNQGARILTDRFVPADLEELPVSEMVIHPGGAIDFSGIDPLGSREFEEICQES